MQYDILHNWSYHLSFDSAKRFKLDAENIQEIEDQIRSSGETGCFSIFLNRKQIHSFIIHRIEDTEEYKNRMELEKQNRVLRVREILRQHEIDMEINHGHIAYDCEGFYLSFIYQGEFILIEELLEEFSMS
jgi:hypothetical protein